MILSTVDSVGVTQRIKAESFKYDLNISKTLMQWFKFHKL